MFTILEYFQGERPSLFYTGQETHLPSDREGYIISSLQSCLFKHLWKDSDVCGCTTENPHPHNKFTSHIVRMYVLSRFSRVRLCDPTDCSPPGSSVHGILQARVLEWVAMPSSGQSSQLRDWTCDSCIASRFFTTKPLGKPHLTHQILANFPTEITLHQPSRLIQPM